MAGFRPLDPAGTLLYYLELAGAPTDGDCRVEILGIVEGIKQDAAAEAREAVRIELDELRGELDLFRQRLGFAAEPSRRRSE